MSKGPLNLSAPSSLSSIPILFFNVHCSTSLIELLLSEPLFKDILILCIQEPPFGIICNIPSTENFEGVPYKGMPYNPNWHIFLSDENHPHTATFICCSCDSLLPISHLDIITSPDFQLISLSFPKRIYFLNCYFKPSDDSSLTYLESHTHLLPKSLICTGGDFNSHLPKWDPYISHHSAQGDLLTDIMNALGLTLSTPSEAKYTHVPYDTNKHLSVIDLIFMIDDPSQSPIYQIHDNWQYNSDHHPLLTSLPIPSFFQPFIEKLTIPQDSEEEAAFLYSISV